jgi:hypothetical protein
MEKKIKSPGRGERVGLTKRIKEVGGVSEEVKLYDLLELFKGAALKDSEEGEGSGVQEQA